MSESDSATPIVAGDHFAAYGLLRRGGGGLERLGLDKVLTLVGPCRIPGALYDLGGFPALIDGDGEVRGELVRVESDAAGPMMDSFENFDPKDPVASDYVRKRIHLIEPGVDAWVYVWNREVEPDERVASGDWLAHVDGDGEG